MKTESQAIEEAKEVLKSKPRGWTYSLMNMSEVQDYIWGYLYDMELGYNNPIEYTHENGHKSCVLVHE